MNTSKIVNNKCLKTTKSVVFKHLLAEKEGFNPSLRSHYSLSRGEYIVAAQWIEHCLYTTVFSTQWNFWASFCRLFCRTTKHRLNQSPAC